jgi:hypothetical protein
VDGALLKPLLKPYLAQAQRAASIHALTTVVRLTLCTYCTTGTSQLAQLSAMTVLSVDTGDLTVVSQMAATGLITDATTNPLFVSQAGQNNDPVYAAFVAEVPPVRQPKRSRFSSSVRDTLNLHA